MKTLLQDKTIIITLTMILKLSKKWLKGWSKIDSQIVLQQNFHFSFLYKE